MILAIKMSIVLGLGLSISNKVFATQRAPAIDCTSKKTADKNLITEIINEVQGMNVACLGKFNELYEEYQSTNSTEFWMTDQNTIQDIIVKSLLASHECPARDNYTLLKARLSPETLAKVIRALTSQREKYLPGNPDKTIGNFTHIDQVGIALMDYCNHNVPALENIKID